MEITNDWGSVSEDYTFRECIAVNNLNSTKAQCAFIRSAVDCEDKNGLINYVEFVYCTIGNDRRLESIGILLSLMIMIFIGLGVTANDFLCPSLLVISKTLKLSQNIAGVTFLAFGNGAPDIFASLAGIKRARPELVIGGLFGAGIFVTTVVAGSIFLTQDFKVNERPLLRDISFYMLATYLIWMVFWNGSIDITNAFEFIGIYLCYITIVIVGRIIYNKYRSHSSVNHNQLNDASLGIENMNSSATKWLESRRRHSYTRRPLHYHHNNAIYSVTHEDNNDEHCNKMKSCEEKAIADSQNHNDSMTNDCPIIMSSVRLSFSELLSNDSVFHNQNEFREFLMHIFPIDIDQWRHFSICTKIIHIIRTPIYFLLTMTTPVVDYESHKNNWCRLLNSFHCISGPICILLITGNFFKYIGSCPIAAIIFCICLFLSLMVYLTSKFEEPPQYHWIFGYIGFVVSVIWIYGLASEIVDVLQAIGIMFSLSDLILGLTVLAWGNSLGDLISDVSMARQGFPRMGLSACFGGPLLNLLLGIGFPYALILSEEKYSLKLEYSRMVTLLYSTITFSLISTLLLMYFNRFHSKKFHGIFLISIYLIYVTLAALIEFSII